MNLHTNIKPPRFETWAACYADCIRVASMEINPPPMTGAESDLNIVEYSEYGRDGHDKYVLNLNFVKARAMEEIYPKMPTNEESRNFLKKIYEGLFMSNPEYRDLQNFVRNLPKKIY